jgi:5-methylcytosine-specific restriction protein B
LPPNLFFIGTLNDDETAHPLAPKVLDRAWPLESPPVDLDSYEPQSESRGKLSGSSVLSELLWREGQFAGFDKALVAEELKREPRWRSDLSELLRALTEWERGFGFRAFDEVVAFVAIGRENEMFASAIEAFDCGVAAKIAPRLRGSGAGVEGALMALESWALERELTRTVAAAKRKRRHLEREGWV